MNLNFSIVTLWFAWLVIAAAILWVWIEFNNKFKKLEKKNEPQ